MESECNAADAPNAVQINNGIGAMAAPLLPSSSPSLPVILYLIPKRILRQAGRSTYLLPGPPYSPSHAKARYTPGDNGSSPLI